MQIYLNILGEVWTVMLVPPYSECFLMPNGNYTIGVCDGNQNCIYVQDNLDFEKMKEVLQHEIAHAIDIVINMPMTLSEENLAQYSGCYCDDINDLAREVMYYYGY